MFVSGDWARSSGWSVLAFSPSHWPEGIERSKPWQLEGFFCRLPSRHLSSDEQRCFLAHCWVSLRSMPNFFVSPFLPGPQPGV